MIKKYKNKVKKRIELYCETNYQRIHKSDMKMGKGLFNHKCHLNAVQQVKDDLMEEVYSCVCFSDSTFPIVHFVNKDKDGKYIDNTLGFEYEKYDYYIIRKIEESEFHKMDDLLMSAKKSLIDLHSNKLMNKILRIDEYNIGI